MRRAVFCIVVGLQLLRGEVARAGVVELKLGPAGAGMGGANPLSLPPVATDLEASYVTDSGLEFNLSVVPGIFVGQRFHEGSFYGSLGAGVAIDVNGAGVGVYSALGWMSPLSSGNGVLVEFKQAVGYGERAIFPYALRIGLQREF